MKFLRRWLYRIKRACFAERTTCPLRIGEMGPWGHADNLDFWDRRRWSGWRKLFDSSIRFDWSWTPRTCSFCSGLHPQDAIRLLAEKWEMEFTDKAYKVYVHPPGFHACFEQVRFSTPEMRETFRQMTPDPNPPAKIYFQHFSLEQYRRITEFVAQPQAT